MGFLSSLFGGQSKEPQSVAQDAISARFDLLSETEKAFATQGMVAAAKFCGLISREPIPKALIPQMLSASDYLRLYKIFFAYLWIMLFIHDSNAKFSVRRMITAITDQNKSDTDRICDALEAAFIFNDPNDPRFTLGKIAWTLIQQSVPTSKSGIYSAVHLTMPMMFDDFRDSVAPLLSARS